MRFNEMFDVGIVKYLTDEKICVNIEYKRLVRFLTHINYSFNRFIFHSTLVPSFDI